MEDIEEVGKGSNQCGTCKLAQEIPEIPFYGPMTKTDLVQGKTYRWCSCGLSKKQPFCDNSHIGTKFKPISFVPKPQTINLICACKYTTSPPYCDGTHAVIPVPVDRPPCRCVKLEEEK